jgi:SET domain-containing protein
MALLPNHPWNTGCDLEFYATRDIPVGEELAIDYSFSAGDRGWVAMGLSSWEVLGYPDDDEEEEEDWEEEDWEEEKSEEEEL